MKRLRSTKLFSIMLVFALIFSFYHPVFASTEQQTKASSERLAKMEKVIAQQQSLLQQKPTMNSKLKRMQATGEAKDVQVIVQLSEEPVALAKGKQAIQGKTLSSADVNSLKSNIQAQQSAFENSLKKENITYKKGNTFSRTFNGMALTVKTSQLDKILAIDGVVKIDLDEEVYALEAPQSDDTVGMMMDNTVGHLGVEQLWENGIKGQGVKVGVIDTGLDYEHPDFKDIYKGGANFVEHDDDYARDRDANDPYETTPEDRAEHAPIVNPATGSTFHTSHGTHVAGIIAGQGKNEYGITGIAPEVDLYAYRVLGAYGSGMTSWVMAGIEKSVEDGMDVINLSLGGGSNDQNAPDAIAINNATLEGVTSIIATGNSGPGRATIGNPASSALGISVGNSTLPEEIMSATVSVEAGDYSNESDISLMAWTYDENPSETLTGEYEIVAIPGYGEPEDFNGLDVEGKVALISRGETPFVDKIAAAKEAGAVATIIHNNVGTDPAYVLLGTSFDYIPAFDMSTSEGHALRDALENSTGTVTFDNFIADTTTGDEINDSSSRGPTTPNFDIKPDVVAPGTNIMAAVPAYGKDYPEADYSQAYDRKTGTSMAAPQVAGVAALLLSKDSDLDPFDIKVAMSNTAKVLDREFDVFAQGPGLVQPVEAAYTKALAYAIDETESDGELVTHEKGTVTFGQVTPNPEETMTIEKVIEVRDIDGGNGDYNVDVEVTKNDTDATVTVDQDSFNLNGNQQLTVSLTVPAGGAGGEVLGYIHITSDSTDLSLPFAANLAGDTPPGDDDFPGLGYYYLDDQAISPDGEGVKETTLHFELLNDNMFVFVELFDPTDPFGGAFDDGYLGAYIGQEYLGAGQYYVEGINEEYISWETGELETAPEGVYAIDLNALDTVTFEETFGTSGPFYIKSTPSEIEFDDIGDIEDSSYEVTGTIADKFVDFKDEVNWEEVFDINYDVNDNLAVTFTLYNQNNDIVAEGDVTLDEEGNFSIPLSDLTTGDYTLTLFVEDVAQNTAEEEVSFSVTTEEPDDPEVVNISLSADPTEPTEGPVTISVETDSESDLVAAKWLEGDKSVDDFAEDGHEIDLDVMAFDVTENDTYTVYVKNENDVEAVETITIDNITDVQEEFEITLSKDPTEPTDGPVTINVETNSESDLVELKWLDGERTAEDFVDAGNEIDIDAMSFEVTENGMYTVYAKNSDDVEAVKSITVININDPDQGDVDFVLELSPTEPTEGPVTITVVTEDDVESLKWLDGARTVQDFVEDGHDIDLETMSFEVSENGIYTVYMQTTEGEQGVQLIDITNIVVPDPQEPEPEEITVSLEPSTTEPTEGPVSITVNTDSETDIDVAKWLEGDKAIEDFADAGEPIDLDTMSFDVTENGTYTVYVKNADGAEAVGTITIDNITKPKDPKPDDPQPLEVELDYNPKGDTEGPVTIHITAKSDSEIVDVKWSAGKHDVDFFGYAGNEISLDVMAFDVVDNSWYTVYVKNADGEEVVEQIQISNIIPDDNGGPGDPGKPGDPPSGDPKDPSKPGEPGDDDDGTPDKGDGDKGDGDKLPKTATSSFNYIAIGLGLILISALALFVYYRRKQHANIE